MSMAFNLSDLKHHSPESQSYKSVWRFQKDISIINNGIIYWLPLPYTLAKFQFKKKLSFLQHNIS